MFSAVFSGLATLGSVYLTFSAFSGNMPAWIAGMGWLMLVGWNGISFAKDVKKLKEE